MATSTLGSKKLSNISRTKNIALKLPKISLTKGYFGQFKGYILQSWVIFAFFCVLGGGVVGHRGFTIVLTRKAATVSKKHQRVARESKIWRLFEASKLALTKSSIAKAFFSPSKGVEGQGVWTVELARTREVGWGGRVGNRNTNWQNLPKISYPSTQDQKRGRPSSEENSVSSSQPIICGPWTKVNSPSSSQNSPSLPQNSVTSETVLSKQYSTRFPQEDYSRKKHLKLWVD